MWKSKAPTVNSDEDLEKLVGKEGVQKIYKELETDIDKYLEGKIDWEKLKRKSDEDKYNKVSSTHNC